MLIAATPVALLPFWMLQGSQYCFIKHILYAFLCEGGALHIPDSYQILSQLYSSLWSNRLLFVLGKFLNSRGVISEIHLGPNKQERSLWTVVSYLRHPLFFHIFK